MKAILATALVLAAASAARADTQRVLIVPFSVLNVPESQQWIGKGVQENIIADFGRAGGMSPVAFHGQVLVEDNDTAARLARAAQAPLAVRGAAQAVGNDIRITAQLIDAKSGDTIRTAMVTGPAETMLKMEDDLAAQLRGQEPTAMATSSSAPAQAPAAPAQAPNSPIIIQQPQPQVIVVSQPSSYPSYGYGGYSPYPDYYANYGYYGYGYPFVYPYYSFALVSGNVGHNHDHDHDHDHDHGWGGGGSGGGGMGGGGGLHLVQVHNNNNFNPAGLPIPDSSGNILPIPTSGGNTLPIMTSSGGGLIPTNFGGLSPKNFGGMTPTNFGGMTSANNGGLIPGNTKLVNAGGPQVMQGGTQLVPTIAPNPLPTSGQGLQNMGGGNLIPRMSPSPLPTRGASPLPSGNQGALPMGGGGRTGGFRGSRQ